MEQNSVFHKPSTVLATGRGVGSKGWVMTVFAACLFALAVFASVWIVAISWHRYGPRAVALRAQLEACPERLMICWKVVERVPPLASIRKGRVAHPGRQRARQPGLDWPGMARAA